MHRQVRGLSYHDSPLDQGYMISLNSKCRGMPAVFSHEIRKHVLGCCCISERPFRKVESIASVLLKCLGPLSLQ